jgi:LysM repeat protein
LKWRFFQPSTGHNQKRRCLEFSSIPGLRSGAALVKRLPMAPKISLFALAFLSFATCGLRAATPENTEQEYQQERKIALRDPKVRDAYDEADRKLEAKIVQIDPALADYVHHRGVAPGGFHQAKTPESPAKPYAKPTPKPAVTKPVVSGESYVVKKGDTLGAIASQYHVTVAALKSANHIVDEKKLAVGQTLHIPAAH